MKTITGNETLAGHEPFEQALINFYRAFNSRDAAQAAAAWQDSERVIMYNPIGGLRRGRRDILAAYEKIMSGYVHVYVEFYDYTIFATTQHSCVVGRERGVARYNGQQLELRIRTSRTFEMHDGRWLQVHHHGSIDEPDLLAQYQQIILGR